MRRVTPATPPPDAYTEGMRIVRGLMELDGANVNPVCRTRVYSHGHRTARALLLLHGFTNCPQQFDALGKSFFDQGWNVLIPRYPQHGYADRLNVAISELRSQQLIAIANQSPDAGAALGDHLTVAGLSLGGVLAGHLAQTHDRVDRAVLIAPMFGLQGIPGPAFAALARLAYLLPNFYIWWNATLKDRQGPAHGYPRFATHAYAALSQTAIGVLAGARRVRPKAKTLAVITNAAEPRLDNRFTYRLIESWRRHGAQVGTFEFPTSTGLPHDLIDPANEEQNTELVYPLTTRMIIGDG